MTERKITDQEVIYPASNVQEAQEVRVNVVNRSGDLMTCRRIRSSGKDIIKIVVGADA